jgi:hypothetical protein
MKRALGLLASLLLTACVHAEPTPRDQVLTYLRAADDHPDLAAIRAVAPEPSAVLCDIAHDGTVQLDARKRAMSGLTEAGDALAFDCLEALATAAGGEPVLRRFALYSWGRRFLAEEPAKVLPVLETALLSTDPADREEAIHALGWGPRKVTAPILRAHASRETDPRLAKLAAERALSLEQPR